MAATLVVAGCSSGTPLAAAPRAQAHVQNQYVHNPDANNQSSGPSGGLTFRQLMAAQPTPDPTGARGAGGPVQTYELGGASAPGSGPGQMRLFHTGHTALEPTLGIAPDGYVYTNVQSAYQVTVTGTGLGDYSVLRTKSGAKFEEVAPSAAGVATQYYSEDPYLYVDPATGRVFANQLLLPCQQTSISDDGGKAWTAAIANCDEADHQTLFAGPPPASASQPSGYPNVVYDCAINAIALSGTTSTATTCDRSLDGGQTYTPAGQPAFVADPAKDMPPGTCDGATGHGFVDRHGTVYLPRGWCGQPYLAMSKDEGASWTRVQVAGNGMDSDDAGASPDHEAGVVVDSSGNIYYTWVAADFKPYLAISRDGGQHWSASLMVAPPGVRQAMLPALAISPDDAPGHLAFAFMGSANAPAEPHPLTAARYGNDVTWNGYLVTTNDALDRSPSFTGGTVNDPSAPFIRGSCGPHRCQAEYDFIDVEISPSGQPWAVFVDACLPKGACAALGESVLATITGLADVTTVSVPEAWTPVALVLSGLAVGVPLLTAWRRRRRTVAAR
jgi:hypothetical protein